MRVSSFVLARPLSLAFLCFAAVCDDGKSGGTGGACDETAGEGESGGTAGAEAVPIAIDCSFVFAANQSDVTYTAGGGQVETAVGGKLIASGTLADDEFEGRSFSLTIYAEDSSVLATSLYQMDRAHLPRNEFYGDHGFTGLNGVKDPDAQENVQFACFARDPAEPPHVWEQ